VDEERFRAKLDEIAAEMGRGARVAGDKLSEWARRFREAWPEVERSFVRFGRAFAASIGAFARAFREAYREGNGEEEEDR
jgi:hypothetical protein